MSDERIPQVRHKIRYCKLRRLILVCKAEQIQHQLACSSPVIPRFQLFWALLHCAALLKRIQPARAQNRDMFTS